ncbi:organic cation transporter 1-like isoform X2 [Stegodyphus dumicola]|uniref:organic cation transporter 1-like isoform X2 n=1 Tax=Stegodyphus dumicola TaxID=202533 RepID=UPI0015AA7BDD|nr:organic cation transporter 1-like isoform X2 [Stegodyphus dumicola]
MWNMVCDNSHYVSFIFMLQNVGSIFGNPVSGYISDRFGRKIAFTGVVCLAAVTEISSIFVKDFKVFAALRAVNGCIFPAMFMLPLITVLEIVSPEKRSFVNGVQNCCWTFGMCLLPAVAYLSRSWVNLSLVVSSAVPFLLLCWRFIPESPRWSISRGKYDEAVTVMKLIAEKNGRTVDPNTLLAKLQALDKKRKEEKKAGLQNSASDILKVPHMRKVFIFMTICWTANYLIYYGLQMNIYNLSGNEFINFFLLSLMETPGNLLSWFFMERYGRRFTITAGFILGGLVCFSCMIEYPYSDVVISVIGKCIASGTYVVTYQRSSELWPTVVRCFGMSATSTIATAISLATPYLIYFGMYKKTIPFLIIGSFCMLAGVLSAFLPETLNENLPQTINDAKDFGKDQEFFSFNRRKSQIVEEKRMQIFTLQT